MFECWYCWLSEMTFGGKCKSCENFARQEKLKQEEKMADECMQHEFRNIKLKVSELKKFQKYAIEHQDVIRKRTILEDQQYQQYEFMLYFVFKKNSGDKDYVVGNDDEFYNVVQKHRHDVNHNASINTIDRYTDPQKILSESHRRFFNNVLFTRKGILLNRACDGAFEGYFYGEYNKTKYLALKFDLNKVLSWTFDD